MTPSKRIFTDIYDRKLWGDGSGGGSSPEASAPYVAAVNALIRELKPRTILDLGCGDGWVASRLDLCGARYIGIDVVDSVVDECRKRHPWGEFQCLDILTDPLPAADLVLCKEVMQHLNHDQVNALIKRLEAYPLVVQSTAMVGEFDDDIETGECRLVMLAAWFPEANMLTRWQYGDVRYFAESWIPKGSR